MNDVWKWVAAILVAFIVGSGGTALFGKTAIAEQEVALIKYKKEVVAVRAAHDAEMDKLHVYQAEVHSRLTDKLEDLKELMHAIQLSQADLEAKMDILLKREFAAHHSEGDGS